MKNSILRKLFYTFSAMAIIILLSSCAQSSVGNFMEDDAYGFWSGIWHGLITPISFVISLFNDDVVIYGTHNIGGWYDLGFILGVSITFGGSGSGVKRC